MSTFPKHDVLGSGDDAPPERGRCFESPVCPECAQDAPREPLYDRLTVPPLSEQDPCYGICGGCGTKGEVYPVGSEWLCYRCAEGSAA